MRTPAPITAPPDLTVPLRPAVGPQVGDPLPTQRQPIDATPLPIPADLLPRVRGYDILGVVGAGGMGVVYEARHRELNRRAAIKTLRGGALADPEYRERFRAEAEAIAKLQHPNVIQVFEVGTVEPTAGDPHPSPFIALEFVDGGSLAQHAHAPQPPGYAARTAATLARAAHAAHALGVIHRDLKPANVLLARDGEPKIADFGIAKQLDAASGPQPLTRAGVVMGTPEYMSPEQLDGHAATPAVDTYALGVILYQLLTGRVPFQGATPADTLRLARLQEPVPPRRLQPAVPRDLETVCLKCLEKEPARRYASAGALADDLERWAGGRPILARLPGPAGRAARWARRNPAVAALSAAVLLVAVAGLAGVAWGFDAALRNEREARANADRAEDEADKNREAAVRERRERYRLSLMAASGGLRLHDALVVRRALDDAPPEHRDWVWQLLAARLDRSRRTIGGPAERIEQARFSPDGRWALVWGGGGTAVWDLAAGTRYGPFPGPGPHGGVAAVSDDGSSAAYAAADHAVVLVDVRGGGARILRGHTDLVERLQFTPDGRELLSAAADLTARAWDVRAGAEASRFRLPDGAARPFQFSPDGRLVGTRWAPDDPPTFWEARTGRQVCRIDRRAGRSSGYKFSPAGDRIATSGEYPDNSVRVWDAATGELLVTLDGSANQVYDVAFSPDGTRLAASGLDRAVPVWDVGPGARGRRGPRHLLEGHSGWVPRVVFSPDGARLLSTSHDRTIRCWDAGTGKPVAVLGGHTASVLEAVFRRTGDRLEVASHAADGTIRLWDVRAVEGDGVLRGHESFVYAAAVFPDGARAASAGWDGTARVWDLSTGAERVKLDHGPLNIVSSVAVRPGGREVATLARRHGPRDPAAVPGVRLWDADTGALLHVWPVPTDYRDSRVTFSPDGTLLAAGAPDGKVRVWEVDTRKEVAVLDGHTAGVHDVAFSPDGTLLASAGGLVEGAVRVWNVATRREVAVLRGNGPIAYSVAWHPGGKVLAAGSTDGTVRLWDVAAGEAVGALEHASCVHTVAFSPDGKLLATGTTDSLVRLWDVATRQEVAELSGHGLYVHAVAFSRDGKRLVSASGDKTVRVWDADPRRAARAAGLSP